MYRITRTLVYSVVALCLSACGNEPKSSEQSDSRQSQQGEPSQSTTKISAFGRYEGYSEPRFNGAQRSSIYVPVRDGTKLVVDIYYPLKDGKRSDEKMPVALTYSGYYRAYLRDDGSIWTRVGVFPKDSGGIIDVGYERAEGTVASGSDEVATDLLRHGYVIAIARVRGTDASFGKYGGSMTKQTREDGYDIVEWLAAQDFANGRVGMFGTSYNAQSSLTVMHEAPPSLKAVIPSVAFFDNYDIWFGGTGVFKKAPIGWRLKQARDGGRLSAENGNSKVGSIVPVDEDADGSMLAAAIEERKKGPGGNPTQQMFSRSPDLAMALLRAAPELGVTSPIEMINLITDSRRLRDILREKPALSQVLAELTFPRELVSPPDEANSDETNLSMLLDGINKSEIPVYHWGGLRDGYTQSTVRWYLNNTQPKKLTIGPWTHGGFGAPRDMEGYRLWFIEHRRWFDYWLKDIDNGIMDESPIHFAYAQNPNPNESKDEEFIEFDWQSADTWPPENTEEMSFYLSAKTDDKSEGGLSLEPETKASKISFDVNYTSTTGTSTRYYDTTGGTNALAYPDMNDHAEGGVVFTSDPFSEDTILFGFPQLSLDVVSTNADGIFNAYIEEVNADGKAYYLSHASIRAKHAATGEAPFDTAGMPWLPSSKETLAEAKKMNEETVRLPMAMQPIANLFEKGHRVRIVITGPDIDNDLFFPRFPAPTHTIMTGGENPSILKLRRLN
ncbi:MAG: CocE/NonD family hydrolase [Pseudomonadota bacterium]